MTKQGVFAVMASYLLIATTPIGEICYALRLLHVPKVLVTQILLAYRYLSVLLMDEPSAALDPRNRRNLIRILNTFPHLKIISSHDLDMILDTCERTILLSCSRMAVLPSGRFARR